MKYHSSEFPHETVPPNLANWLTWLFLFAGLAFFSVLLLAQNTTDPVPTKYVEPEWIEEKPLRKVENLGRVLSDIESHMPKGHIYTDPDYITWGHETTHGIHSRLRNKYSRKSTYMLDEGLKATCISLDKINCFYVLENRAIVLKEPKTTITVARPYVPLSLRGPVWHLYMHSSAWDHYPLYIFDEWVAYCNGSAVRHDLKIKQRSETVTYALELNVYAMAILEAGFKAEKTSDPKLRNFFMWNTERTMELYRKNGPTEVQKAYLKRLRTSEDAEDLRRFVRNLCGEEWTKKTLGF